MLTTAEVAEQLGLSIWTVQYHVKKGNIVGTWDRGKLRISLAALERFKQERRSQGRPQGSKDKVPRVRKKGD